MLTTAQQQQLLHDSESEVAHGQLDYMLSTTPSFYIHNFQHCQSRTADSSDNVYISLSMVGDERVSEAS
jgi:hypothetical protein